EMGNIVHIISRRVSYNQRSFEQICPNIYEHRIFRGMFMPITYRAESIVQRSTLKNILLSAMTYVYLRTVYMFFVMIHAILIIHRHNIDGVIERASSYGAGVYAAKLCGIPSIVEVIDPEYSSMALRSTDKIFAYTTSIFKSSISREKIEITTAGVDLRRFDLKRLDGTKIRRKYGIQNNDVIVYVGSLEPWHGIGDLISAMSYLGDNVRLLVVGGKKDVLTILEQLASEKGVSDRVIFVGSVDHSEVPNYIAAADVACAPFNPAKGSLTRKHGFFFSPIKIFEYMACEKPVVATNIEIVSDIVKTNNCGVLVEPGDPVSLAEGVDLLLKNKKEAQAYGKNGRKAVQGKYTWDIVASQLYGGLLDIIRDHDS
ncbi:MAG: glycosyltransferase family 4 protein, partial [Methanocellales archaeon]|nr:glycosyltransferase family 4 protein [Methanocellales archaeon]